MSPPPPPPPPPPRAHQHAESKGQGDGGAGVGDAPEGGGRLPDAAGARARGMAALRPG